MLDRVNRLTRGQLFKYAVRRGRRAGSRTLVLHLAEPAGADTEAAQVGLVVGRGVGGAVTRNRVKRRLRHLMRDRVTQLPSGSVLVVRALPPAASASGDLLAQDLDRALGRLRGARP